MSRSASEVRFPGRAGAALALLLTLVWPGIAEAQDRSRSIVSSEISLSRDEASLRLGYGGQREDRWALRDGRLFANEEVVGEAARGGPLDEAWRELLNAAMEVETAELARLLIDWDAPETGDPAADRVAIALDQMLEERLSGVVAANAGVSGGAGSDADAIGQAVEAELSDSMSRLVERISELQERVERYEDVRIVPNVNIDIPSRRGSFGGPFRHFFAGLSGIFSNLVLYAVLFGIAFATIFFGGRKYIEGVADTMRAAPTRSLLVGLAASFLIVPAFILGVIALLISIVGIPALLLWVPLFPVAVCAAVLLGYIGAAHAGGEALAERRFYASDWFQRGNSYYFILTGLGMLLSLFVAGHVVQMAGPWLGFLRSILVGLGVVLTGAVLSMGFGAVLLSRAGTRPMRPKRSPSPDPDIYAEATNV